MLHATVNSDGIQIMPVMHESTRSSDRLNSTVTDLLELELELRSD